MKKVEELITAAVREAIGKLSQDMLKPSDVAIIVQTEIAKFDQKMFVVDMNKAVEAITAEAYKVLDKEKIARRIKLSNKRFARTDMLLENYTILKQHVKEAIYKPQHIKDEAIDILERLELDDFDDELFIQSIKSSTQRTALILEHVDKMLEIFRKVCIMADEKTGKEVESSKYYTIEQMYLVEVHMSVKDIAGKLYCDRSTVYEYKNDAIRTLSGLIFGLEGLVKNFMRRNR